VCNNVQIGFVIDYFLLTAGPFDTPDPPSQGIAMCGEGGRTLFIAPQNINISSGLYRISTLLYLKYR